MPSQLVENIRIIRVDIDCLGEIFDGLLRISALAMKNSDGPVQFCLVIDGHFFVKRAGTRRQGNDGQCASDCQGDPQKSFVAHRGGQVNTSTGCHGGKDWNCRDAVTGRNKDQDDGQRFH